MKAAIKLLYTLACAFLLLHLQGGMASIVGPMKDTWELNLLLSTEGFLPPRHLLSVSMNEENYEVSIAPIPYGAMREQLFRLGVWLGYTAVVPENVAESYSRRVCSLPNEVWRRGWKGVFRANPPGLYDEGCSTALFPLQLPLEGVYTNVFPQTVPLETRIDGKCAVLPWAATGARVLRLAPGHVVVGLEFLLPEGHQCEVLVEGIRVEETAPVSITTLLGPLAILVLVWLLKSQFLKKRVEIGGQGRSRPEQRSARATLTQAQRLELLQRQHDIIQKMKQEDLQRK